MRPLLYLSAAPCLLVTLAVAQPISPTRAGGQPAPYPVPARRPAADWAPTYAKRITATGLRTDLTVLASDAYAGRATGQPGQQLAATYLAHAFSTAGLSGPVAGSDNPYYQSFTLRRTGLDPASSVTVGGRTFVVGKDFYVLLRQPATVLQPAFVGFGISTAGYADFTPADPALQGKDLVLLLDEPRTPTGQPLLAQEGPASPYGQPGFAELLARSPQLSTLAPRATIRILPSAAALARVPQDYANLYGWADRIAFPDAADAPAPTGANVYFVSPEMGAALLGTTEAGLAAYRQAVSVAGKPLASPFQPLAATVQVRERSETFTTANVLGYLPGSDKKDEVVVLSAHYDHVGVQHGQVYNGADDDGSGTVAVLAMARAFAQAKRDGHGPRRSLLFLAHTAEEIGLLGSQYYTDHPVFPLAATVANLHLDMVGRVDSLHAGSQGDYLYLLGDNWLSTELHRLSEATNRRAARPLQLDYRYNSLADPSHLYYRSDHYNFAKHGVPVIYYFSGFHRDYHQPGDDVAKIDFPALTWRSQLVFRTAWAVANRPERLRLDPEHRSTGYQPVAAELDRYVGQYVTTQATVRITIARVGNSLEARPEYQYPLALEPVQQGVFKFDQAGVRVEFDPTQPRFTLSQGGYQFLFTKAG